MPAGKTGVVAGKAFVILEAIDGTAGALRAVERNLMTWGSRLQSIGARIFARGLTAMVPSALGTNVFKQFDDIMRRVQARTQGSSSEMEALRQQAIGLGKDSAFSAREVASLQDVLAQRKFNRTEIAEMTPSILMLGRAAGSGDNPQQDLLNAADLVSQAIMMYEMNASDAAKVSDIFTAAANESNFALEDLIISMANGGPVAHQYGLALEETLAIMMVMRDLSIDSSVAGTGLRNLFLKASDKKAVGDFNKLMMEMTGSMLQFEDSAGNLMDPASILFSFDKLTKNLGTAQRGHLLAELFGLRAITPATAVAANAKNFTDALAAVRNSTGETERAYTTMEEGIGGVFRRIANIAEAAGLELGKALERPVIAIGNRIHQLVLQFIGWMSVNQQTILTVTFLTAGVTALAGAMFVLGSALKLVAFVLRPIHMALGLMISTIRILIISAIVPLIKLTWQLITTVVSLTVSFVSQLVPAIFSAIGAFISMAMSAISFVIPALMAVGLAVVTLAAKLIALAPELVLALMIIAPFLLLVAAGAFSASEETDKLSDSVGSTTAAVKEGISAWQSFLNMLNAVFDFTIGRATEMAATIQKTFSGVNTAMMAGDMTLAWEIGITGLELLWTQFLDFFWDSWFNIIKSIKSQWLEFQMWLGETEAEWNPFHDPTDSLDKFNKLNAELRANNASTNENETTNDQRRSTIKFLQDKLNSQTDLANRRKEWMDKMDWERMNNQPQLNAPIAGAIKDLIQNGANTGVSGAKAIESARGYTMEGAKQAYENQQNRLEALQNQELKKLDNIDRGIGEVNTNLGAILSKPAAVGGV
jgi:TP901 family phage tail tape measure protein